LKTVRPVLGLVQPVFVQKSKKRLVLEPHVYILTPTSLPHRRACTKLHSQLEKHLPLSLTHLLPLPFQIFGEKSLSEIEELRFLCFIS
jgi:protein-disulfide isomerase